MFEWASDRGWERVDASGCRRAVRGGARAYCDFVETAGSLATTDRLSAVRVRLLALYTAALSLPVCEPGDVDVTRAAARPANWPGFGDKDVYWEAFDPYQEDEPVCGSLSDDMLGIYADLQHGLALWHASHLAEAIWEWRFGFESHWGSHAIDALRALDRACKYE